MTFFEFAIMHLNNWHLSKNWKRIIHCRNWRIENTVHAKFIVLCIDICKMYKCFVPKDVFANFITLKIFGSNFRDETDSKPPESNPKID